MGGLRSLYCARPGHVLVGYDKSQIEFRIAAYGSGDEEMIKVCEGGDVHSMNAAALFPGAFDPAEYKRLKADPHADEKRFTQLDGLRTLAKSAVFAVCYLAEADTVYQRILAAGLSAITPQMVEAMLRAMRARFRTYYQFQDWRLQECVRTAYTSSPILGRQRWLGHEPSPPECANFLCQAGAADVMNAEICAVDALVRRETPSALLVAHVYDSVYFDVPASAVRVTKDICLDYSSKPVTISSSGKERNMVLKIDIGESERWH
jgi:DNA polymerase I-like protein with 3'-5' exonuclease and polymerase domains